MSEGSLARDVSAALKDYPDFPEPGILFRDIVPLFRDPVLLRRLVSWFATCVEERGAGVIVGIESRGFLLGVPVALELGRPFTLARKAGKLPGATERVEYALEYGTATIEMQRDAIAEGDRVYVIDDLLATGGTAAATARVVEALGGKVVGLGFLIELGGLGGRAATETYGPHALVTI